MIILTAVAETSPDQRDASYRVYFSVDRNRPYGTEVDRSFTNLGETVVSHAKTIAAAAVLTARLNASQDAQVPCVTMALGSLRGFRPLSEVGALGCSVEQCSTR
jgi:hypothetical protein